MKLLSLSPVKKLTLLSLLLAIFYKHRRSPPGLIIYLLAIALPKSILRKLHNRLLPAPQRQVQHLDVLAAAMVDALRWFIQKDYAGIKSNLLFATGLQVSIAKNLVGGHIENVKVDVKADEGEAMQGGSVEGHWLTEKAEDVPRSQGRMSEEQADQTVVLLYIHGGDSAGGNLTIILIKYLTQVSPASPPPLASILFSPWVDLKVRETPTPTPSTSPSTTPPRKAIAKLGIEENGSVKINDILTPSLLRFWGRNYTGSSIALSDPRVSPLYLEPGQVLVPTKGGMLIIYGGAEVLVGSIRDFVRKLHADKKEVGSGHGRVQVHEYAGMPHDFNLLMLQCLGKGRTAALDAVAKTSNFIIESLQ
ncbi:hypothetical protein HDV05_007380 [Chytridiales sp. JEL 0842]|nr:hypothetical protein HDV05_007380 [Chytridiales sp. JEL 0842]